MPGPSPAWSLTALKEIVARHWGFRDLRPLQEPAMRAVLDGRDSLVVLPTGGGKSLCYQAPAVLRGDTTVIVSPLISLMKDQVDGLQSCGVPAIQIDSSQTTTERSAYEMDIVQGTVRLVFVSPERLVNTDFYRLLQRIDVRSFAIDEAHCISHWGHDFRPEYRQMRRLRELFPKASLHAYTATATQRVRDDIVTQLELRDAEVLVGNFDRPNLTYRVLPRQNLMRQVLEVLGRHKNQAGIIYCIRRADVDELTAAIKGSGFNAMPYHAGLTAEQRKATQDAFANEECDLVVATVAFGMGIDRSNIRYVLHTAMPKSVEHYQQETGRAGRDGLEAECVLLHSGADFMTWKWILEKSAEEPGVDPSFLSVSLKHLSDLDAYSRGALCRHKALVGYFGQRLESESCGACDICLGDAEEVPDAAIVAQKILSCVARVKEGFGITHVSGVLRGENTDNIRRRGHDKLSTYGLLKEHRKPDVRDWIYQLIGQGVLEQVGDEYPLLKLNAASWEVMRGERSVRLMQPVRRKKGERPEKSKADTASWEGVDQELFDALRGLRKRLADERKVQPYIVFSDATLRELARVRPTTLDKMRAIYGIGVIKLRDFGDRFLKLVDAECRSRRLSRDNALGPPRAWESGKAQSRPNPQRALAFDLFRGRTSLEEVIRQTGRGRSTVYEYLEDYIREERPASVAAWVTDEVYERVKLAARRVGTAYKKPIFIALGERVSYDDIRIVLAHLGPVTPDGQSAGAAKS
jgi:ATP-dependent DNA helicase RecQ